MEREVALAKDSRAIRPRLSTNVPQCLKLRNGARYSSNLRAIKQVCGFAGDAPQIAPQGHGGGDGFDEIAAAWPSLSESFRAAVLAIVRSQTGERK